MLVFISDTISLLNVIVCILPVALLKPYHECQKKSEVKKVFGVLTDVITSIIAPWGKIVYTVSEPLLL